VNPEIPTLSIRLAEIAQDAGQLILRHYAGAPAARRKADSSPVTAADEEAEALILDRLRRIAPDVPVIAEEEMTRGIRPNPGDRFFLVDPLDGTKEFLQRNGEFTVNIALIEKGRPVAGVVLAPALEWAYIGEGGIAFAIPAPAAAPLAFARAQRIQARRPPPAGLVAIASRTHRDQKTDEYLSHYPIAELRAAGSSLKFCVIASGEADLYPRHGPTMEWDTAAGQAVLEAAGGSVTTLDGTVLRYGKVADEFRNPYFIAKGLPSSAGRS
jgi:3'(2'), 5'-bisphosphate nucleotidase